MPAFRFLHGVDCKEPDAVDAKIIELCCSRLSNQAWASNRALNEGSILAQLTLVAGTNQPLVSVFLESTESLLSTKLK